MTLNLVPGDSVYGEKRINVEVRERVWVCGQAKVHLCFCSQERIGEEETKVEYRVWNPFRSKLAAAILGGVDKIHIHPGSKVLYLGAASGTTVSHVADIVGPVS